jgi:hypothetical protein
MSWWDAFALGYGLGLGPILSQVMVILESAALLVVAVGPSR